MKKISMKELKAAYKHIKERKIESRTPKGLPRVLSGVSPKLEEAYRRIEEVKIDPKQKSSLPANL